MWGGWGEAMIGMQIKQKKKDKRRWIIGLCILELFVLNNYKARGCIFVFIAFCLNPVSAVFSLTSIHVPPLTFYFLFAKETRAFFFCPVVPCSAKLSLFAGEKNAPHRVKSFTRL